MSDKNEVAVQEVKKYSNFDKAILLGLMAFAPAFAMAEGIDTIGAGLTSEVTASKAIILTLFGIGATVLALFAGYRYMKRGANSA
ncbi:hypothetical protein FQ082_09320 [Psychrobacter sp. ANT_H56B]|uniref:HIG1 domain-containing protein n=1 Tax=Psychrobacter sp. ANT_H56B TaxID=2597353 RepID=UPI0011F1B7D8|nr:HIG1 domain-containing protein [Psychrobacter sp. ANT_H56B]KAA0924788.1 hypothetical protein FQ082_09320 [Psychrobacter sp. ANT_H56B]